MENNFDKLIDRSNTDCLKWNYFEGDVLPMWVADMDFQSPSSVIEAIQERAAHGVFGYRREAVELKAAIADRMMERYRWRVLPEEVSLLPGVVQGFNLACHTFARPGGEVLMQTPVYFPFYNAPGYAGMRKVENCLYRQADLRYAIDFEDFKKSISESTALFMLCNPHNPVGRVFDLQELEKMAEICLQHGVPICSDEIHSDLVFSGYQHIPIAALDAEVARNTITLIAPSKTFNIAGLECSAAIIQNEELRDKCIQASKGLVGGVNLLGITAALAAYQNGQQWLDELMTYLESNRDWLRQNLMERIPQIRMTPVEGTYLTWLDCTELNLPESPADFFLKKAKAGFVDGEMFGKEGKGFIRMNFGCPRTLLEEGFNRMAASLTG